MMLAGCLYTFAQTAEPLVVLEAENADSVHAPAKVKSVADVEIDLDGDGVKEKVNFSNGKYVGGNDPGSYLFYHDVEVKKEGAYEFRTYFNCSGTRRFTIKVNDFKEVECAANGTAKWDTPPAETTTATIWLNAGKNTIKIAPYPTTTGAPNFDKFEVYETDVVMEKPQTGFPMVLEAEYAQLYGDLTVKDLPGMSNDKYVGGFNNSANSYMEFTCVNIPEEGTYELVLFTNDPTGRPLDIQINNYAKTYINVNKSPGKWEEASTAETSVPVWFDKGLNTISFTESGRSDGPNFDKIEIHLTDTVIEKPDIEKPYPESCKTIDEFKISYMGSSVMWGQGAEPNDVNGYAYRHAALLKERHEQGLSENDWITSNISIGGNTTQAVLDRWERDLLRDCGRYVFYGLSLGNERNGGISTEQAAENYEKGMKQLIEQAREVGIIPVMSNNYTNGSFNLDDYRILKQLNLIFQEYDVPSVNTLGAIDDGTGKWVKAYESDGAHPNSDGHREFFYAIVPSLFDALHAQKPQPVIVSGTSLALDQASGKHVEFVPENIVHPFTLSFEVNTTATDATLASFENENGTGYIKLVGGQVVYESPNGTTITASAPFKHDDWQRITLTHYYAWGQTMLYVNADKAGSTAENLVPKKFFIGGNADAPAKAEYRQLFFWRSGMNEEEIAYVAEGRMMKSSLEIYAPLGGEEDALVNLAQSLNTVSMMDNENSKVSSTYTADLFITPNPVKTGEKVTTGNSGSFEIYTLNGMLVDRQVVDDASLSTTGLVGGTYLVRWVEGAKTGRLVVY